MHLAIRMRNWLSPFSFFKDIGYGEAENIRGKGPAFARAKKAGQTDALKRCLRNFGEIFNCLSDDTYVKKVLRVKARDVSSTQLPMLSPPPNISFLSAWLTFFMIIETSQWSQSAAKHRLWTRVGTTRSSRTNSICSTGTNSICSTGTHTSSFGINKNRDSQQYGSRNWGWIWRSV